MRNANKYKKTKYNTTGRKKRGAVGRNPTYATQPTPTRTRGNNGAKPTAHTATAGRNTPHTRPRRVETRRAHRNGGLKPAATELCTPKGVQRYLLRIMSAANGKYQHTQLHAVDFDVDVGFDVKPRRGASSVATGFNPSGE